MGTCDRRTFLKRSAMASVTTVAGSILLASCRTSSAGPVAVQPAEKPAPALVPPEPEQQNATVQRGADHPFFKDIKRPEVIAHRGGNGQWPGETMYAYKKAMEIGVDVLEMDVYLTKDKHLVLMHDNNVKSTTNYAGPQSDLRVHNFMLAELKELNAAYHWSPGGSIKNCSESGPDKCFANDPDKDLRVTSLQEVFDEFPGMRLNIEMKKAAPGQSPARKLSEMICQNKMTEKVLVASFSNEYLQEFRSLCPEVATSASGLELAKFGGNSLLNKPSRPDFDAIQVIDKLWVVPVATEKLVASAHCTRPKPDGTGQCRQLPVHTWTVNNLEEMQRVIGLGVDGIITDYPGPLLALLGRISHI